MKRDEREQMLLKHAADLAESVGYSRITREAVAARAGVSPAVVNFRFGTMAVFKRHLMRYAIRNERLPVVAQGLAIRDAHARRAPDDVKKRAIAYLTGGGRI
jgi:AcrR family transcriptional regulator